MSTTDPPPAEPNAAKSIYERICFVCDEAIARWVAAGDDDTLGVCDACRSTEPCRRCYAQIEDCECPEGPDRVVWVPAAARG